MSNMSQLPTDEQFGSPQNSDREKGAISADNTRRRLYNKDDRSGAKSSRADGKGKPERWQVHCMAEDYCSVVGDLMYPKKLYEPFGYDVERGNVPLSRINTLGYLTHPLRRRHAIERWSPYEVAVFEASITLYGKNFHRIHQQLGSKTTKEVIEFYYCWKKTSHYKQWKANFVADLRDTPVLVDHGNSSSSSSVSTSNRDANVVVGKPA